MCSQLTVPESYLHSARHADPPTAQPRSKPCAAQI
uniref:Uncharacterized protein n=1 Tax=Arundo donax TaxID=35708 RepID=A0A0A9CF03_ARUDO